MCLISVLPKGTVKFSDEVVSFIKSGAGSNNQGSGYAFKKAGSNLINVNKGFFDCDKLIEAYQNENLEVDDEVIIHHRIGTQGRIDDENCHPFIVSSDIEECVQIQTTTDKPVLAHNGMFRDLARYDVTGYSDTFSFANGLMAIPQIMDLFMTNQKEFEKLFKNILGYSKVVFLFPDRDLMMSGDFHQENGYFHSNAGYKSWVVDRGGSSFEKKTEAGISFPKKKDNTSTYWGITRQKISGIKREGIASLTGDYITIYRLNKDDFIFKIKPTFNFKTILERDEYYELVEISSDYFYTFAKIQDKKDLYKLNFSEVHTHLQFIPKHKKYNIYKDYIYLIDEFPKTKSALKNLRKTYIKTHKQPDDARVFCKTLGLPISRDAIRMYVDYIETPTAEEVFVA